MTNLGLVPLPVSIEMLPGCFRLAAGTILVAEGLAIAEAEWLASVLHQATGFPLPVHSDDSPGSIRLVLNPAIVGDEAYRLHIDADGATLTASTPAGLGHAAQTLLQLLPPAIYGGVSRPELDWSLPCLRIVDAPRFPWRDLMLDCSRHFMPMAFLYRLIDLMAIHKLNRFHWHLTDDQGWRIEIRKYPRLTEIGAWRRRTQLGHKSDVPTRYDDVPHGGFYTQSEIHDFVAYAGARHIEIVPEIDMPGHVQSAIAAYPELGNGNGPEREVSERWQISEHLLNPSPATITFMLDVFDEVLELFPCRHIHVGGDECRKQEWRDSPAAQAVIAANGLGDEDGLQSWLIGQIGAHLTSRGRVMIGWDEILEGGLAPNAVVMSWRGMEGGIAAAQAGHDVIMTPQTHVYLDYYQVTDHRHEPLAIRGATTLEHAYAFEPVSPQLEGDAALRVIGTGAKLWTEYVATTAHAEYMLLPRSCAIAELAWSPRDARDFGNFRMRMERHVQRLTALGFTFRQLDPMEQAA